MSRFLGVALVVAALALGTFGCAPRTVSAGDARADNLSRRDSGLQTRVNSYEHMFATLRLPTEPEPATDIKPRKFASGQTAIYLAFVKRATVETSGVVLMLDFVTPGPNPNSDAAIRKTSAEHWMGGWNRIKHAQSFPVRNDATLLDFPDNPDAWGPAGEGLLVLSPRGFAAAFRGYPDEANDDGDTAYYVQFDGGGVESMWPVPVR